jgi:hypothetical protein
VYAIAPQLPYGVSRASSRATQAVGNTSVPDTAECEQTNGCSKPRSHGSLRVDGHASLPHDHTPELAAVPKAVRRLGG